MTNSAARCAPALSRSPSRSTGAAAHPRDGGQRHIGVGDAESSSSRSCGSASRDLFPDPGAGGWVVQVGHAAARRRPRHGMKRDLTGVRFAEGPKHLHPTPGRRHRPSAPPRPNPQPHTTAATDRALHHGVPRRRLLQTDQARLGAPDRPSRGPIATTRRANTLDAHLLPVSPASRRARRVARWTPTASAGGHRFHPLRQPDLLADRGVPSDPNRSHRRSPTRAKPHPRTWRSTPSRSRTSTASRLASSCTPTAAKQARTA